MKNSSNVEDEILEEIEVESSKINESDLNEIISNEKTINNKSSAVDKNRFKKFINQIKLTLSLIKDFKSKRYNEIPWRSIAMIAAAVLYFLNPFDIIPDILPVFGYADDALLFAALFKSIQSDLEKYCDWKGLNNSNYF